MPISTATVQTKNASRYLQQLCKHFGHKVPVEFTPEEGRISLPFGACSLKVVPDALTLNASSEGDDLPRVEKVIGDHLARFAFRESPTVTWNRNP